MPMDVAVALKVLKGMLIKVKADGLAKKYIKFAVRNLSFEGSPNDNTKKFCNAYVDD